MQKESRLTIAPVAVVALLALLAVLVVKRGHLTADEAEVGAVQAVVKVQNTLLKDKYAVVAALGLVALFAFVMWTELRAKEGDDQAMPQAEESSANGTRECG